MANLNITDINITFAQVAKSNSVIVIESSDFNEFIEGKAGRRLGTRYSCVAPSSKYIQFYVKVPDQASAISQEQIDSASNGIMVCFDNFEGKFYRLRNSADYSFTAKATGIKIVSK